MKRVIGRTGLVVLSVILMSRASAVLAEELPPVDFIHVNPDGTMTLDTSRLTPTGVIAVPPPESWSLGSYEAPVPGTDITACLGCMVFNTYTTSQGQTVVVPTAYTAMVLALTGESPFDATPDFAVMNGALGAAAYLGAFREMGIDPEEVGNLERWKLDPLFWLRLNASLNNPADPMNEGAFFWASGLFVFSCHPTNAECEGDIPEGPPTQDVEVPTPPGNLVGENNGACPADLVVSAPSPMIEAAKLAPNFPVVVGQDPERRGVDLAVSVRVPPVIVSYNVPVEHHERRCDWVGPGKGAGCAPGAYDNATWQPWMAGDDWRAVDATRTTCERRTETHLDRIATLQVAAELSPESIAWITGDLAARYPGARVYQATWALYPGLPAASTALSPDGTSLGITWERIPLRDPGDYFVRIEGATAGTPYTAPRPIRFREIAFGVDLVMVALTK